MAAKIKLQRKGARNQPFYRVVVQDESSPRDGRVIEILGHYNPCKEPSLFEVDKQRTLNWIQQGAEPTEKVRILLGKAGILPPLDLASLPKHRPKAELKAKEGKEEKPKEAAEQAKGGKQEEKPAPEKAGKEEPA